MEIDMNRVVILLLVTVGLLVVPQFRYDLLAQVFPKNPQLDRSKPVPSKDQVVNAWQKRQDAVKSFRFSWTEQQIHPPGWLPNPRYPQREWLEIPGLFKDRTFTVTKSLAVDGNKMRYSYEHRRPAEADGWMVKSPQGDNKGLGEEKHYTYVSVFDGQTGKTTLTTLLASPPPVVRQSVPNVDAQNLDTRPLLMAFRPLDPVMGHLLIARAVTNQMRSFYQGKSTCLVEERFDPSGWKMILRIEPERDFIIRQFLVVFQSKLIGEINIDYVQDAKWGWIPSAWQVSQMLADGSMRLLAEAKVSSYSINQPIGIEEFQ
jgi:hypothetical protein